MKNRTLILVLFIFIFLFYNLFAEQTNFAPKGVFNYSPPSKLRIPKIDPLTKTQRDIQVWNCNFETDISWNLNGCWERGPVEVGPSSAYEGTSCLGTNLDGLYPNSSNANVTSTQITIPSASYVELTFYEWFELESGYDFGYVEVFNGTVTQRLDARTGTSGNEWRQTALNLTPYAGQTINLIFHFNSDASVPGAGWYIDNANIIAQEPLPLALNISGVNTSNYPSIYINATVSSQTDYVNNLVTENFNASENGIVQATNFTVITPSDEEQNSSSDIVFVLDVTSSMEEEINSVKQNMLSFVNSLFAQHVDYRIGLVVFGDIVYVYNNYQFYNNTQQILNMINNITLGEHGIDTGGDYDENQVEAMAEGCLFQWRPGAARVLIMLTDAASHEDDSVTQWTMQNLLAQRLIPNDIIVFPIFNTNDSRQLEQYLPIAQETNPQGTYFDIYDNFNNIISQISNFIGNIYTIHYTSTTLASSPLARIVHLHVSSGNQNAEDYCYYLPGMSPVITRSDQTIAYDTASQPDNTAKLIGAYISDIVPPFTQNATLYWRHSGETPYQSQLMTEVESGYYTTTIPSAQMTGAGIEYYLNASDGQTTNTIPSCSSAEFPFSFAIAPNAPAVINITSQTYNSVTGLTVAVTATSAQNLSLKLFYRPIGALVYEYIDMMHTGGNNYTANISQVLSDFGMQFFLKATSSQNVITYKGMYDNPYLVLSSVYQNTSNSNKPSIISDLQCQPNPFSNTLATRSQAKISFDLNEPTLLKTSIYNIKGELVKTIADKIFNKGSHSLWWDMKDSFGNPVGSGLYFYMLETAKQKLAGKLIYLK